MKGVAIKYMDFRSDILKKIIMFSEYTHECDTMIFKKDDYHYIKAVYGKKRITQTLDKRIHIINKITEESDSYPFNYDMSDIELKDCIVYGINENKVSELKIDNCLIHKIINKNTRKIRPYPDHNIKSVKLPVHNHKNTIGYSAKTPLPPIIYESPLNEIKNVCNRVKKFFTNVTKNAKKYFKFIRK